MMLSTFGRVIGRIDSSDLPESLPETPRDFLAGVRAARQSLVSPGMLPQIAYSPPGERRGGKGTAHEVRIRI